MASTSRITVQTLERRLMKVSRSQFVSITAVTDPRMRKRGNPFAGEIVKVTTASGAINWRYARVVNRQRTREGKTADFTAQPRPWGTRIRHTPLVQHESRLYLEVKVQHSRCQYLHKTDRVPIPEARLLPYLPKAKPSRQELDNEVTLRDYRLDHIGQLRIDGELWTVRPVCDQLHSYLDALSANAGSDNQPQPVEAAS